MVLWFLVDLTLKECSCSLKALGHVIKDERFKGLAIAISLALSNNLTLSARDAYIYARARPSLPRGMHIYMLSLPRLRVRVFLLSSYLP